MQLHISNNKLITVHKKTGFDNNQNKNTIERLYHFLNTRILL